MTPPWWLPEVEAVRAWARLDTSYSREHGLRFPTHFTPVEGGFTTPCGPLLWHASPNAVRLVSAKGMPHIPVVPGLYAWDVLHPGVGASFVPKVLHDAIGTSLDPWDVGFVLRLPRYDVERLALIARLGGDQALRATLMSEYGS